MDKAIVGFGWIGAALADTSSRSGRFGFNPWTRLKGDRYDLPQAVG